MRYITVRAINHPFRSPKEFIFEHRYVMELHLGRKLKRDEVVHHINHVKSDNRLKNLELMSNEEHSRFHNSIHGKWARKFDFCIDCGSNKIPHCGKGRCDRCFSRFHFPERAEANKKYKKIAYRKNRIKMLKKNKDYYKNNPDKYEAKKEYCRNWHKENFFDQRAKKAIYRKKNRVRLRDYFRLYRKKQARVKH